MTPTVYVSTTTRIVHVMDWQLPNVSSSLKLGTSLNGTHIQCSTSIKLRQSKSVMAANNTRISILLVLHSVDKV